MFLATDCGCICDYAGGHDRVRMVMGNMLANLYRHHPRGGPGLHWSTVEPIIAALDGEMSDDAWEEREAIDWLNKSCFDDTYFSFEGERGGLFLLCPECPICGSDTGCDCCPDCGADSHSPCTCDSD